MVEQRLDAENTITTSVQPGRIEETSISNHYNPITDSHGPRMQNGNNMPLTGGDPGYMTAPADTPAFTSSNFPSMGSFPNSINSGGQTYSDSANMSNTEEHSMEHGGHLSGRIWSDTKTKVRKTLVFFLPGLQYTDAAFRLARKESACLLHVSVVEERKSNVPEKSHRVPIAYARGRHVSTNKPQGKPYRQESTT